MPPGLATFLAEVIAFTCREFAKNLPVIKTAWVEANTDTLVDSKPDPAYDAALRKEQADAIAHGTLPPADVR